jgi:hypothetical protein
MIAEDRYLCRKTKAILLKMRERGDIFCPRLEYYKLVRW